MKNTADLINKYHTIINPLANSILFPISNGFSTTLISAPKVGKTSNISYILSNISIVSPKWEKLVSETSFLWLYLSNQSTPEELISQLNDQLDAHNKYSANWNGLSQNIQKLFSNGSSKRIVFLIDNSELLATSRSDFAKELFKLSRQHQEKVLFVFLFETEISLVSTAQFGELTPLISGDMKYLDLLSPNDIKEMTLLKASELTTPPSEKVINEIAELSGGHPGFMRVILREYAKDPSTKINSTELLQKSPVIEILTKIWDSLTSKSKNNITVNELYVNEHLVKTGLKKTDGRWFSDIMNTFVGQQKMSKELSHNSNDESKQKVKVSDYLTGQEYTIFKALKNKEGFPLSRDEIAVILWGKNWPEKYSDWAIEQHISQIRKKLKENNSKRTIKTIYNRGFQMN